MIIFGGLLCIGIGLLNIFALDFMWSLTVNSNRMEGKASERTETWDSTRKIGGVFCIIIGIGLVIFGLAEPGMRKQRELEQKQRQEEWDRRMEKITEETMQKMEELKRQQEENAREETE